MSDHPTGPPPDPTSATTAAEFSALLARLRSWAGDPGVDRLRALGATGSVETLVAACLRARQWAPADVEREVARWKAVAERVASDSPATGGTPTVPVVGPMDATTVTLPLVSATRPAPPSAASPGATPAGAAPASPSTPRPLAWQPPPVPPAQRSRRNAYLVLAASVTALLVLVGVPVVVATVRGGSDPVVAAPATSGPATPDATPVGHPGSGPVVELRQSPQYFPEAVGPSVSPAPPPPPTTPAESPEPSVSSPAPPSPSRTKTQPPGPWSAIVDNATPGRFRASGEWATSTDSDQHYGDDFRWAKPNTERSDAAWYKFDIPKTGQYRVEAWFPAKSTYNTRTPFVIVTTEGNQTVHIDQRSRGGRWVLLGTFTLAAGDHEVVAVSRWASGGATVVADAIRITEA